jgi:hypothetical protein
LEIPIKCKPTEKLPEKVECTELPQEMKKVVADVKMI